MFRVARSNTPAEETGNGRKLDRCRVVGLCSGSEIRLAQRARRFGDQAVDLYLVVERAKHPADGLLDRQIRQLELEGHDLPGAYVRDGCSGLDAKDIVGEVRAADQVR